MSTKIDYQGLTRLSSRRKVREAARRQEAYNRAEAKHNVVSAELSYEVQEKVTFGWKGDIYTSRSPEQAIGEAQVLHEFNGKRYRVITRLGTRNVIYDSNPQD